MRMPHAALAGVQLLADQVAGWTLTAGIQPYQRIFYAERSHAEKILEKRGRFVELELFAPGCKPIVVQKLLIIGSVPGDRPENLGILVTDRRALWPRIHVARSFNVRRRNGQVRLLAEGSFEGESKLAVDVDYAKWSLKEGTTPWKPLEVLAEILTALGGEFILPAKGKRQIEVENLEIDSQGDFALSEALVYLAGYDVTIDLEGTVRVFDTRDRSEIEAVRLATPVLYEQGWAEGTQRDAWRPARVEVLFERECELRFDYNEEEARTRRGVRRACSPVTAREN
jgi:hypothetical protein